jgi:hypothetical protein
MARVTRGTRIDAETTQLTIRVSRRVAMRAEALIELVGRDLGIPATRTDVIREAILRGLDVLEAEAAAQGRGPRREVAPARERSASSPHATLSEPLSPRQRRPR